MPTVKVLMLPITGPGDVLKIQDILAEVLKGEGVKELHGIGCACGNKDCDKRLDVHRMRDGRTGLVLAKGADVITGIVLDVDTRKRLVEQLGGTMGG